MIRTQSNNYHACMMSTPFKQKTSSSSKSSKLVLGLRPLRIRDQRSSRRLAFWCAVRIQRYVPKEIHHTTPKEDIAIHPRSARRSKGTAAALAEDQVRQGIACYGVAEDAVVGQQRVATLLTQPAVEVCRSNDRFVPYTLRAVDECYHVAWSGGSVSHTTMPSARISEGDRPLWNEVLSRRPDLSTLSSEDLHR